MSVMPTSQDELEHLKGKRVLVVEDEGITQMHIRKILTAAGMTLVGSALSGPEGVEAADAHNPDVILMDINMPGDYNGLEASRRILEKHNVCIIMITAYMEYAERAKELGSSGYLLKPLDRASLLREISAALDRFRNHNQ